MFVFCIVVSALASGLVVASKSLFERLQETFGRIVYGVHHFPKLKQTSRSNAYQEPDRPPLKVNGAPRRPIPLGPAASRSGELESWRFNVVTKRGVVCTCGMLVCWLGEPSKWRSLAACVGT